MTKREILKLSLEVGAGWALWQLLRAAFTKEQRDWIVARDEGKCQFPVQHTDSSYRPCGREKKLQVHHIKPQRWSKENGLAAGEVDVPENGITLCERHHQTVIHPDMALAMANYSADKQSFQKAIARRNQQVKNGEVYWNTAWDEILERIAKIRTQRFGGVFPPKKKR